MGKKIIIVVGIVAAWAQLSIAILGLSGLWVTLGIGVFMGYVWGGALTLTGLLVALYVSVKVITHK